MGRFNFISEFRSCTEDVYLNSEVKGKLVSSLLPQSEGKRKEAGPASFGNGPSESSNWYVAGRFDRLISKVNGEDWGWTTWWCTCQLSSQEDMIILKPLFCKSHVHSKVASLVDWWGNQPRTWGANLWAMNLQVAQEFAERLKKVLEEANLLQGLGSCNREDQHPYLRRLIGYFDSPLDSCNKIRMVSID